MVKLSLWGAPKIKANLGITLLPGLHCCWILHWDVTDCAGMMSDTGMDALLGFQLVLLGRCQAIFPHSHLPGVHLCFSVASAGTWLRALVWNMWCTPRLSGPGIPNVLQRAAAQDLVPNLSSGKWLGVLFFLPGAWEFVSDCRYLTFLLPPHRSEPFIHVNHSFLQTQPMVIKVPSVHDPPSLQLLALDRDFLALF